jgi:outer membrane protein assembly factor BamB
MRSSYHVARSARAVACIVALLAAAVSADGTQCTLRWSAATPYAPSNYPEPLVQGKPPVYGVPCAGHSLGLVVYAAVGYLQSTALYAIDEASGETAWQVARDYNAAGSFAVAPDGTILDGVNDFGADPTAGTAILTRRDACTGRGIWRVSGGFRCRSDATAQYVVCGWNPINASTTAINMTTGATIWSGNLGPGRTLLVRGGVVLRASRQATSTNVSAYDIATGAFLWGHVEHFYSVLDVRILSETETSFVLVFGPVVRAFDTRSGAALWSYGHAGATNVVIQAPTRNDMLYSCFRCDPNGAVSTATRVGLATGRAMWAANLSTWGFEQWSSFVGDAAVVPPSVTHAHRRLLFVVGYENQVQWVMSIDFETGAYESRFNSTLTNARLWAVQPAMIGSKLLAVSTASGTAIVDWSSAHMTLRCVVGGPSRSLGTPVRVRWASPRAVGVVFATGFDGTGTKMTVFDV